ncbi:MAG: InlB B-repeat-containing protein [Oscillospiraceae bacterium]|nr:InlB B-repeat-containing protein [Oscillospiraceae bacterium]
MKTGKQILALLLCGLMLLALFPLGAFAQEEEPASDEGTGGTDVVETVDSEMETLLTVEEESGENPEDPAPDGAAPAGDPDVPDVPGEGDAGGSDDIVDGGEPGTDGREPEEGTVDEAGSEPGEGEDQAGLPEEDDQPDSEPGETVPEDEASEEEEVQVLTTMDELTWEHEDGEYDGEELFRGYAAKRLAARPLLRASSYAGRNIESPAMRSVYALLKGLVTEVAAGTRTSTYFSGPITDITQYGAPTQVRFTAEELGLEIINEDNLETAKSKVREQTGLDGGIRPAVRALLADCPYELYWYDKTVGSQYGYSYSYASDGSYIEMTGYVYVFTIAGAYAGTEPNTVSGEHAALIDTVIATAQQIVQSAANYDTMDRLDYYRTAICDRVTYNHAAADKSTNTAYGDPWQLIYVFDGDPDTNVVCEGYSKAFQYLCELSDFPEPVRCISVSGTMNGGAHMWNIVSLSDGNYMADVTNCDDESVGWPTELFLTGYDSGNVEEGYDFLCGSSSVSYVYDEATTGNFTAEELTLVQKENAGTVTILVVLTSEGDCGESVGLLSGGGRYSPGETITATASDVEGYTFLGWYYNGSLWSTNKTVRFSSQGTVHLIARYEGTGMATLRVGNCTAAINGEPYPGTEIMERFLRGSEVTVQYVGDETQFVRWCNESGLTVGTEPMITVNLLRDMTLRAVVSDADVAGSAEGNEAFVEFVSDYGQVISASVWNSLDAPEDHSLPSGPVRTGRSFRSWSSDGYSATDAAGILALIDGSSRRLQMRPLYSVTGEICTLTVDRDGMIETLSVPRGNSVKLTAEELAGRTFLRWEDENGTLLGTQMTYRLMAAGDRTLRAVYADAGTTNVEAVPVLAMTGMDAVSDGSLHRIAFRLTRSIPEGYTLQRLLLMITDDGDMATEESMLIGKGIPQAAATVRGLTGTFTVNKKTADDAAIWYARGYMLVTDEEGAETEVYTPIASASYADLVS